MPSVGDCGHVLSQLHSLAVWLDKYLDEKVCVSLLPETYDESDMPKKSKQQLEEEFKAMKAENKRLLFSGKVIYNKMMMCNFKNDLNLW